MEIPSQHFQKKNVGPCVICGAEGFEGKFRRFTDDAKCKALRHGTFDPTWEVNVTQFCHSHYMSYIVRGAESFESTNSLKRRWEDEWTAEVTDSHYVQPETEDEATAEGTDPHHVQAEPLTETAEVSDVGRISEIDFIGSVRSMAQILYAREKKEKMLPIYDWVLLRED